MKLDKIICGWCKQEYSFGHRCNPLNYDWRFNNFGLKRKKTIKGNGCPPERIGNHSEGNRGEEQVRAVIPRRPNSSLLAPLALKKNRKQMPNSSYYRIVYPILLGCKHLKEVASGKTFRFKVRI